MIVTENLKIRGREFIKNYSDEGLYIERDGVLYSEAIDPAEFERKYIESDIQIESDE